MFIRHRLGPDRGTTIFRRAKMGTEDAIKITRLANGQNPKNGEVLQAGDPCMSAESVKALNKALSPLIQLEQWEKNRPPNAFRTWTRSEDTQVCDELRKGIALDEMAKLHHRTVPAILARLMKLGKISPVSAQLA
jgi:hypothetical protein